MILACILFETVNAGDQIKWKKQQMIAGETFIHDLYKLIWFLLRLHFCNIKGNVKG